MKRWIQWVGVTFASVALLAGCGGDDGDGGNGGSPPATAQLRVLHGSADAPNVDAFVDGAAVATNAPYTAATAFATVPAGTRNVKVNAAGTSTTVIDANVTAAANQLYTVIAADRLARIGPLVVTEDASAPAAGNVRLRVVHGSPIAGNVDVYVTAPNASLAASTPTLANIAFKSISNAIDVPGGNYQIRITVPGNKTAVYDSGSVNLASGANLVVVALDRAAGASPISLVALTRDPATPKLDLPDTRASVRAVHASPDTPNVDVLVDGTVALANVPYPTFSNYLAVPSGPRNFKVNVAGTSTTAIDATPTLAAGKSYSVFAVGFLASISGLVVEDKLAFPTPDKAFVRVVHASPDAPNIDVLVNGAKVLSNVPFRTASDYLTVPAGAATVGVNVANTSTAVVQATLTFDGGKVYTVAALGSVAPGARNPLQLKAVVDR